MKKIGLAVTLLAFIMTGCKKDKNCDLSAANFVGAYKLVALKYKADAATPEVDEYATMDACEKDDVIFFNAVGTITYSDAGTQCVPPGDDTGFWSLVGTALDLDGENATVAYFDCNSTTLTIPGTVTGELTTITLAKQ